MSKSQISELLSQANSLKPKDLIISDLKWKCLLWAVYRQKNILFVGHTRCGKTKTARAASEVFYDEVEENVNEGRLKELQNNPNIKIEKVEEI